MVDKLDVDNDGLVPIADLVELARAQTGLGRMREDDAVLGEVQELHAAGDAYKMRRMEEPKKPRREDIVEE